MDDPLPRLFTVNAEDRALGCWCLVLAFLTVAVAAAVVWDLCGQS